MENLLLVAKFKVTNTVVWFQIGFNNIYGVEPEIRERRVKVLQPLSTCVHKTQTLLLPPTTSTLRSCKPLYSLFLD